MPGRPAGACGPAPWSPGAGLIQHRGLVRLRQLGEDCLELAVGESVVRAARGAGPVASQKLGDERRDGPPPMWQASYAPRSATSSIDETGRVGTCRRGR